MWVVEIDQISPGGGHMRHSPYTPEEGTSFPEAVTEAIEAARLDEVDVGQYQITVTRQRRARGSV